MTEPTPAAYGDESPAPDFDLDAWLDGATVTQVSVEILRDGALLGRWSDWERRYNRAKMLAKDNPDAGLGDENPLAELEAEGEDLLADMRNARSVWFLRALSSDDAEAIETAHPMPEVPPMFEEAPPAPPKQVPLTEAQAEAYVRSHKAWEERRDLFNLNHKAEHRAWGVEVAAVKKARSAEKLSRALVRIEVDGRVIADRLSLGQARELPVKIGEVQEGMLLEAVDEASSAEPEIPAGFLSRSSEIDRD